LAASRARSRRAHRDARRARGRRRVRSAGRRPHAGRGPRRARRRAGRRRAEAEARMSTHESTPSLSEVHRTVLLPRNAGWLRRLFAFAGPAYLVSVGYMDPGNWATDLAGGARFGYRLRWGLPLRNPHPGALQ